MRSTLFALATAIVAVYARDCQSAYNSCMTIGWDEDLCGCDLAQREGMPDAPTRQRRAVLSETIQTAHPTIAAAATTASQQPGHNSSPLDERFALSPSSSRSDHDSNRTVEKGAVMGVAIGAAVGGLLVAAISGAASTANIAFGTVVLGFAALILQMAHQLIGF